MFVVPKLVQIIQMRFHSTLSYNSFLLVCKFCVILAVSVFRNNVKIPIVMDTIKISSTEGVGETIRALQLFKSCKKSALLVRLWIQMFARDHAICSNKVSATPIINSLHR